MQVYVVQSGDSLYSIANSFNTSINLIRQANELDTSDLVIGQSLVIPITGQYYFIQEGDSLFTIAEKFHIAVEALARINQISPTDTLSIGDRLYIPPEIKTSIRSLAYIEPFGNEVAPYLESAARDHAPLITFLAPFSYRVNRDGSLSPPPLNNF